MDRSGGGWMVSRFFKRIGANFGPISKNTGMGPGKLAFDKSSIFHKCDRFGTH